MPTSLPQTAAAPRRPYAKSAGRRRQILDVAVPEFAVHGYVGGSLRRIAGGARLSTAGILHHFATKEGLFLAAVEDAENALPNHFDNDVRQHGLRAALLRHAATSLNHAPHPRLLLVVSAEAATPSHPAHHWLLGRDDALRQCWAAALRLSHESTNDEADLTAAALVAAWTGLRVHAVLDSTADVLPTFQRCLESLIPTHPPRTATTEGR